MSDPIFFDTWIGLLRIVLVGTAAYAAPIVMLRISGKRTRSKLDACDLVVTVASGLTLATVLLNDGVRLFEGLVAFALLICLQFSITRVSVRSDRIGDLVKAEPTLLVHRGRYLDTSMRQRRVTRDEIVATIRAGDWSHISDVGLVVLETEGSMPVVPGVHSEGAPRGLSGTQAPSPCTALEECHRMAEMPRAVLRAPDLSLRHQLQASGLLSVLHSALAKAAGSAERAWCGPGQAPCRSGQGGRVPCGPD